MLWHLRPPKAVEDLPFIYNSWLKSCRDAPAFVNMTHGVYYKTLHDQMEAVFKSSTCHVVVACAPGEENVIYGYGIGEVVDQTLVIQFLYVKHPFRTFGVAKALEAELLKLPHTDVAFSCWTRSTAGLQRKRPTYQYNPWFLWAHK